jgi:hypothetical protein
VLFAGYGFGDQHINEAFNRFRNNRRRPVAIIGHAKTSDMCLGAGQHQNDRLATAVVHTLHTNLGSMQSLGQSTFMSRVGALLEAKEFEISSDPSTPLAVWYNGFLEACDNPDKVMARLVQGP